jgi:hypothetical protein
MNEGYVIEGGCSYYCSIQCLNQDMSDLEYNELYNNGNSETYWTEWDVKSDAEYQLINGTLTKIKHWKLK